jgi:hypothetical protein
MLAVSQGERDKTLGHNVEFSYSTAAEIIFLIERLEALGSSQANSD